MVFSRFPVMFGDYLLAYRVASGGMADVYCAKNAAAADLGRLVAIKCMRPEVCADEESATMFIAEAKLASTLIHANIVQILDLGRVGDQLYIAMELVQGRDLAAVIKAAREADVEIPMSIIAYIATKAAEALDFAHAKKGLDGEPLRLIHGDISPQNILVSYSGEVKLVDFGIAHAGERRGQPRTTLQGKFAYMAPEQTVKGEIDHRVDIFALGSVIFELITGRPLFDAESKLAILDRVRKAEIPKLELTDPRIRGPVLTTLITALAKKPENRFDRAVELGEALSPLLIEENRIVGSRQAAELMRTLFAEQIEAEEARQRQALELRRPLFMKDTQL